MRIDKLTFVKYIDKIKDCFNAENELYDCMSKYRNIYGDFELFALSNLSFYEIELLSWCMGIDPLKDDLFSWWCCELDFGQRQPKHMFDENDPEVPDEYKHPDLSSAEKLYDFALWYSDYINGAKKYDIQ